MAGAGDLRPGRRAANRHDGVLPGNLSAARRRRRGTRVCTDAGARRCGCGDRRRAHGGGARRGARLRERGSHHARGVVASDLRNHREIGDGQRHRRFGRRARSAQERVAAAGVLRHGCDRQRDLERHQLGAVRRAGRIRGAASCTRKPFGAAESPPRRASGDSHEVSSRRSRMRPSRARSRRARRP